MYIRGESMSKELEDILKENISAKGDKIVNAELTVKKLSFLQLRDAKTVAENRNISVEKVFRG